MPRWWPAARRGLRRHRYWRLLRRFVAEAVEDRVPGLAAETAFFVVLGVFPGLLIATGLLGVLDVIVGADLAAAAKGQVVGALETLLTDQASAAVGSVENLFDQSRGQLITVATLGALVTISGAFAVVIEALNLAYGTTEDRGWVRRRLLGLVMGVVTLVAVVFAMAALIVGPFFGVGRSVAEVVGLGSAFSATWTVLRFPVVTAGLVLWLTTLFHFAPNRRSRWRGSLPGAVLTTVLWVVASLGLHLYLSVVAGANPVIGAFGGGAIVMTWTYLLCVGLLLGGELNAVVDRRGLRRRGLHRGARR